MWSDIMAHVLTDPNMFIPAEVFIKNDIQVIKLSSTLYSRPIYTDWKLI